MLGLTLLVKDKVEPIISLDWVLDDTVVSWGEDKHLGRTISLLDDFVIFSDVNSRTFNDFVGVSVCIFDGDVVMRVDNVSLGLLGHF